MEAKLRTALRCRYTTEVVDCSIWNFIETPLVIVRKEVIPQSVFQMNFCWKIRRERAVSSREKHSGSDLQENMFYMGMTAMFRLRPMDWFLKCVVKMELVGLG